jgi:hypothetical protein
MSASEHLHCICTMYVTCVSELSRSLIGFVLDLLQLDAFLRGKVVVFTALDVYAVVAVLVCDEMMLHYTKSMACDSVK